MDYISCHQIITSLKVPMSAIPKKKLCWNCEGNISRETDNCPYCGVYLLVSQEEDIADHTPPYTSFSGVEEIPSPFYQREEEVNDGTKKEEPQNGDSFLVKKSALFHHLKQDVFPILFLMMGSLFFLFGVVLYLFSENGTLTLQWKGEDSLYFLLSALPLLGFGWFFLERVVSED